MITRHTTIGTRALRIEGEMTGMGCEDAALTFFDAETGESVIRFHVEFYGHAPSAERGFCAPMIVPDRDPSLIEGVHPGDLLVGALAAAFSIADEELAGDRNAYSVSINLPEG